MGSRFTHTAAAAATAAPAMSSGNFTAPPFSMDNFVSMSGFGVMLIVVFVALILFGAVIMQTFSYYIHYPRDRWVMKGLVALIVLLDSLSTLQTCASQFLLLVANWGNLNVIPRSAQILALNPLLIGLIAFCTQSFFAWRLFKLSGSWILVAGIVLCSVAGLGGAVITTALSSDVSNIMQFSKIEPFSILWLVSSALCDVAIAAALSFQLRKTSLVLKAGGGDNYNHTKHMIDRLVRITVQNGLLTAVFAITDLILFLIFSSPTRSVSSIIPKLYSITVLTSLNSRFVAEDNTTSVASIAESGGHTVVGHEPLSSKTGNTTSEVTLPAGFEPVMFVQKQADDTALLPIRSEPVVFRQDIWKEKEASPPVKRKVSEEHVWVPPKDWAPRETRPVRPSMERAPTTARPSDRARSQSRHRERPAGVVDFAMSRPSEDAPSVAVPASTRGRPLGAGSMPQEYVESHSTKAPAPHARSAPSRPTTPAARPITPAPRLVTPPSINTDSKHVAEPVHILAPKPSRRPVAF